MWSEKDTSHQKYTKEPCTRILETYSSANLPKTNRNQKLMVVSVIGRKYGYFYFFKPNIIAIICEIFVLSA